MLAIDTFFSFGAVQTRSFDTRRATPVFAKFGGDGQQKFGRDLLWIREQRSASDVTLYI